MPAFDPTSLPAQYDHQAAQDKWYAYWDEQGYFHADPASDKPPFSVVIPPPNVTGALHLGHALNNTLQDILIRTRRMQGYNTLWMPGTDHAGIATQAVVERRLLQEEKLSRHDLGRGRLVERIWQWKDAYEKRIIGQLKRMGCSCDWQRTRFTFDEICARAVRHTFFRMFGDGLIYRGKRLVNWDTFLQTAVSDDEVFHDAVAGHFWHFRYPVLDPQPGEPGHVTIATTRPETMLGDTAVAVHPDPAAALDKLELELREKLAAAPAAAKAELEAELKTVARRRKTHLPELIQLRDMARDGRRLMLPLLNREIPLIADEWAKPELGSGCVKITPAHDPNDYEVGLRQSLPMINILNPDGTLNENAGPYAGLTMKQARQRVVEDLDSQGLLGDVEDREIDLAHSDRSKTPIEPYLADQWFVKMDRLAQSAMDAVTDGRVKIVPARYAKGYLDWLGEKRDWCIGRQLWWGHRVPVWHPPAMNWEDSNAFTRLQEKRSRLQQIIDSNPDCVAIQRGTSLAPPTADGELIDFHPLPLVCVAPRAEFIEKQLEELGYKQDDDVLDTWFSSALWPHSTLGWPEQTPELDYYYPTSTLITSRDIITLWVARMVLTGIQNVGDVPFREVFIHPKILDGDGETMSKSKGNGVDPLDVLEKFGADALRFALAYITTETQDVRMPVEFECPHCGQLIAQTKQNRVLPRVACKSCGKEFSTQWAEKPADIALPRGAVVSDRFELGRNFCNKLWNASRFAMLNLEGYASAPVTDDQLAVEDRWILSRLATVTAAVTDALDGYKYAEAARQLYDFAWDEFCSFYVEMSKSRLEDDDARPTAQRVLVHVLDNLLRLLHPIIPFLTEDVWQLLAERAPVRGLEQPAAAAESIMIAPWPECDARRQDAEIEARFARFQEILGGLREIRSRQNIAPKIGIEFSVRCPAETAALLEPMRPYFQSMARAAATAWGPHVETPATCAKVNFSAGEVIVDLAELIDIPAEIARNEKERGRLLGFIAGKEKQLANSDFVDRAPPDVVQRERSSLAEQRQRLESTEAALAALRNKAVGRGQ